MFIIRGAAPLTGKIDRTSDFNCPDGSLCRCPGVGETVGPRIIYFLLDQIREVIIYTPCPPVNYTANYFRAAVDLITGSVATAIFRSAA